MLGSEIEREVFLFLVEEAELRTLVGVNDGEDFGNRLSDIVAIQTCQYFIPIPPHSDLDIDFVNIGWCVI